MIHKLNQNNMLIFTFLEIYQTNAIYSTNILLIYFTQQYNRSFRLMVFHFLIYTILFNTDKFINYHTDTE